MKLFLNRLMQNPCRRLSLAAALMAMMIAGCSGQKSDVSGQVTRDGKPLVVGSVAFFPAQGLPVVVALDEEGRFFAPALYSKGAVQVAVYAADPIEELKALPKGPEYAEDRAKLTELRKKWVPIPPRYNDPGQSGLVFTPSGATTTFDIALTSR